jgi:hypothetical protein
MDTRRFTNARCLQRPNAVKSVAHHNYRLGGPDMEFRCLMTNGRLGSVESGYSRSLAQEPDPIQILHWSRFRAGRSAGF